MSYFRTLTRAAQFMGRALLGSTNGYDGASTGRRLAGWTETDAAVSALLSSEGDEMRRRCRGLVRKNPWAKSASDAYVANTIGTGITPQPMHSDPEIRTKLKQLWLRSTDEMDADGRTDFYGLQALVMREIFEAGEVLARFRPRLPSDGLQVPLQIQVMEPEHLPLTFNDRPEGGNVIRAGIEFTPWGKRAAYHLYREHPGVGSFSLSNNPRELTRVPAEAIAHCFATLRAGQMRGQPWLAPVMVTLYELDQFVDAVLVRQKLSNMLIGWQRSLDSDNPGPLMGLDSLNGNAAPEGAGFGELQAGTILDLGNTGMTLDWSKPPDPAASLPEFLKMILHAAAAGIGIPYTLIDWNTSDVNFSSMRGELNEFRRRVEQLQYATIVYQFCRPVWQRWVTDAVLAGKIPKPKDQAGWDELYSVKWRTPKWPWVNPLQDVMAAKESVRCGFESRAGVIHEIGYDPEEIDMETAADNRRADELGLVYDSDPRQTANNGAAQATVLADQGGNNGQPAPSSK